MGETVAVTHLDGYLGNSKTITSITSSSSFQYFNKNRFPDIPSTHTHGQMHLQHNDNDKLEYGSTGTSVQIIKTDNNSSHDSSSNSSSSKSSNKGFGHMPQVAGYKTLNTNGNTWSSSSSEEEPPGDYQGDSSDYTDAKSTLSAPVELLSEFLSAVMARNYEVAHKLCQSILKFEPNNSTVKEFYPLIAMRLHQGNMSNTEDEDDTSTDEGNESEDTMDSCSSLGDEDQDNEDDENESSSMTISNMEENKNICNKYHSIYLGNFSSSGSSIYTTANSELTTQSLSSGGSKDSETDTLGAISASPSCELTIDSGDSLYSGDSVFSSTDSDLTLEAVIKRTGELNV